MRKVGVYFGSFDPIHKGHIAFARAALQGCGLDKVFFMVEPRPVRKQGVKAFEHRTQMVQLAIQDNDRLGSIILEQPRFTVESTLPILQERFKGAQLHLLMGDDILSHFADWPHIEDLVSGVQFVIGLRKHSQAEVRRRLGLLQRTRGLGMKYQTIAVGMPRCSSASIRQQLRRGMVPDGLPLPVLRYIQVTGLYTPADDTASASSDDAT